MKGTSIDFIVPNKYKTVGSETNSTFSFPMFNQDYSINYSYSDIAYESISASGQEFPEFSIAKNLKLISRYNFSWDGLIVTEKIVFENFIKSFNNSFQPFILRVWLGESYTDYYMIIEQDTLQLTKDKYDLWSTSFTCIEMESL